MTTYEAGLPQGPVRHPSRGRRASLCAGAHWCYPSAEEAAARAVEVTAIRAYAGLAPDGTREVQPQVAAVAAGSEEQG